jgi:hypothetical protein
MRRKCFIKGYIGKSGLECSDDCNTDCVGYYHINCEIHIMDKKPIIRSILFPFRAISVSNDGIHISEMHPGRITEFYQDGSEKSYEIKPTTISVHDALTGEIR